MRRILYILLALALVACGDDRDKDNHNEKPENTSSPSSATLSPALVDLQQDYESLRESYQAISEIWDKLATNQTMQCGNDPAVLSPEAISAGDDPTYQPLADLLRRAAIDLDHSLTVWKAECINPRQNPSPDVINEGRLAAGSAGDALREAETLLADIQ
jgi:hypothetical protein